MKEMKFYNIIPIRIRMASDSDSGELQVEELGSGWFIATIEKFIICARDQEVYGILDDSCAQHTIRPLDNIERMTACSMGFKCPTADPPVPLPNREVTTKWLDKRRSIMSSLRVIRSS